MNVTSASELARLGSRRGRKRLDKSAFWRAPSICQPNAAPYRSPEQRQNASRRSWWRRRVTRRDRRLGRKDRPGRGMEDNGAELAAFSKVHGVLWQQH